MDKSADEGKLSYQHMTRLFESSHTSYQLIISFIKFNVSDSRQMKTSLSVPVLQLEEVKKNKIKTQIMNYFWYYFRCIITVYNAYMTN